MSSSDINLVHKDINITRAAAKQCLEMICIIPAADTKELIQHWLALNRRVSDLNKQIVEILEEIYPYSVSNEIKWEKANIAYFDRKLSEINDPDSALARVWAGYKASAEQRLAELEKPQ